MLKLAIVYSRKEVRLSYKNNHKYSKSANLKLNIICKIGFKI